MFRSVDDFLAVWREESATTARVLERLTDASLQQRVADGYRTLGELAWHLTVSHRSILDHTGLTFEEAAPDRGVPRNASELSARYVASAAAVGRAVEGQWTDATLRVQDDIYGAR